MKIRSDTTWRFPTKPVRWSAAPEELVGRLRPGEPDSNEWFDVHGGAFAMPRGGLFLGPRDNANVPLSDTAHRRFACRDELFTEVRTRVLTDLAA